MVKLVSKMQIILAPLTFFWLFLAFQNTTVSFTGPSDCHKLILQTVLTTIFPKNKPEEFFYRDYKKFNFSDFNDDLKTIFSKNTLGTCYQFFLNLRQACTIET